MFLGLLFANHHSEFFFADDVHTQFFRLLQFGWSHIVASQDKGGLAADTAHILAPVQFYQALVFVAAMMLEYTADDDAFAGQQV